MRNVHFLLCILAFPSITAAFLTNCQWSRLNHAIEHFHSDPSLVRNSINFKLAVPFKPINFHQVPRNCKRVNFWRLKNFGLIKSAKMSSSAIENSSAETFDPVVVTVKDRSVLRIVPSTTEFKRADDISLSDVIIKPGFGWGEGTHPSTYMCLQFICSVLVNTTDKSMLDYGTGSGVLALAAKRCGATRIVGVDKDDEILQCAQENTDLNFMSGRGIEFIHGREVMTGSKGIYLGTSSASTQFDLVVANMLPAALVRLAPTIVSAVKIENGVLALCGMRRDQVADVKSAYEANGVRITEEASMVGSAPGLPPAEWVLLRGTVPRRSNAEERARLDYLSDAAIG